MPPHDDPAQRRARAAEALARKEEAMGERDELGQADQKVDELKKRIARQLQVVERAKQTGHSTAAEAILQSLERSLRTFEKHRQVIFERQEAKRR